MRMFTNKFSATGTGAIVAWMCSEEECVDGIAGFYGSPIRNYSELVPQYPVLLFFALQL
ncbi:hypothetical protein [Peribacillus muralis]|uniref:hypothetical protein n=1 Tax=Peribacillus muralis TaxID=264697 RepID=UPI0012EA90F5|nr:hypothetical protein [Peribacillus muralis]